jgi:hypothetical protein
MKTTIAIVVLSFGFATAYAQAPTPSAAPPTIPTVTFTQSDLAQHDEEVSTMAVLNYMAQQAKEKARAVDAKVSAAFAARELPAK